jgi:hypothetical protein
MSLDEDVVSDDAPFGRAFGDDGGLVQRGPYGVVRRPIYVACVLLQLG